MALSVLITLTAAGTSTGPFDLYSDVDGYTVPFEVGVPKLSLQAGYLSLVVPNATTVVRAKSNSVGCQNFVDMPIVTPPTTASFNLTVDFPDYPDESVTDLKVNSIPVTVLTGTIPTASTGDATGTTDQLGLYDIVVVVTGSSPTVSVNVITPTDGSYMQSGGPGAFTFTARTINGGDNLFIAVAQ